MEIYKIENLSFAYPSERSDILKGINLTIKKGEFITLCGNSGSGKTTLLRLLKPITAPVGRVCGDIYFNGKKINEYSAAEQAEKIGYVMQDPDNGIVADKVWHELAFGLESLGFSNSEIRTRVAETAAFFGIDGWFHKKTSELSGGQKQTLALASVMLMQPEVLILDEPTSSLDPISAQEFINTLKRINSELGITVILSEHRLENTLPVSDRVMVADGGKIIADGTPSEVCGILNACEHDMYFAFPAPMRIYGAVENGTEYPITVRDGRKWLESRDGINTEFIPKRSYDEKEDSFIELSGVWFRYDKQDSDTVKDLSIKIHRGEIFTVMGGNGAGKTTMLSLISGIRMPYRGKILIDGKKLSKSEYRISAMPQNPQYIFTKGTVRLDLCEPLKGLSEEDAEKKIRRTAELCQIENLLESHPYDLSGGEQQRAALAKVLLCEPDILLLDEPTKGLDSQFKTIFADILKRLKDSGVTIVMVSHDIEFCAEYSDRCAMFFDGGITAAATPQEFFTGKSFYSTSTNRMARTTVPEALLPEDVIRACGAEPKRRCENKRNDKSERKDTQPQTEVGTEPAAKGRKAARRTRISAMLVLPLMLLTVLAGKYLLNDRKYYFISLLVILESMLPFYLLFEGRKPQAREIVVISAMCATAVAGRAAFFMLPQFKPVTAIIIMTGVCLGGETGFLVGTITGFVSNFFFGQGPWTPWQMFSLGIIGFVAGFLTQKKILKKTTLTLCVFGAFAAFFIYGGIMNPASVMMYVNNPTLELLLLSYVRGVPFDLIHAAATVVVLRFLANPMLEKLERIKIKYGLCFR